MRAKVLLAKRLNFYSDKVKRLTFLSILSILSLVLISSSLSVKWSSPSRQFNVTPDILYLNWTNDYSSNITITKNVTFNLTVEILNGTQESSLGSVHGNYSQSQDDSRCTPDYYHLFIVDPTGYNNTIKIVNSVNVSIIDEPIDNFDHLSCSPGRYWIQELTIRNATVTNENTNITVFVDIPISQKNNENLLSTGVGSFNGKLEANSSIYHSFFFNITELSDTTMNVTGVAINLSGWSSSQDIDLFLFDDSQNLKAKSVNNGSQSEFLLYNFLPPNSAMWEIRIYGNSTSQIPYEGNVIFTGLDFINASNGQRISNLDFGTRNASYQQALNITLKNELNISSPGITQSIVLYQVKRFNGSGAKNFTFFVPDSSIATKIKASLYWNGDSNYSINVYDEDGDLVGSSINKHVNAKKVGVEREEYVETTSIGSRAGFWRVEVKNHTTTTDPYNLTVRIYVSSSDWFETNFSQVSLNGTYQINNSTDIQINLTVPNNTMNGTYEGYIQYLDSRNGGIRIPLRISVTTPMLIVNDTMSSMTAKVDENYGANLTKTVIFFLNNTGDLDLSVSLTNSSGKLTCVSGTGCSNSYFANFTYNQITSIPKNSYKILQVNISFNSSMPKGIYQGWITIWGNNSNVELSAHPYSTFNITLKLNLTDSIRVDVFRIKTADGDTMIENSSRSENVTAKVELYYVNGTPIGLGNILNVSNFTVWLVNRNVTSYRIPTSGSLSLFNGTTILYLSGYNINFTVPANKPGGYYDVHVSTSFKKEGKSFTGEGINTSLVINNTGLFMSTNASSCNFGSLCNPSLTLQANSTYKFFVKIYNFGTVDASSATITFSESCSGYSVDNGGFIDCGSPASSDNTNKKFTISPPANSSTCIVYWTIKAGSSRADYCTARIIGGSTWFYQNGINVSIRVTVPSTTTSTTTTTVATTSTTTTTTTIPAEPVYLEFSLYPSKVSVEQNESTVKQVKIKNVNDTVPQTVKLEIFGLDSSWYSISPKSAVIHAEESYTYKINFTIPENASVKDYPAYFKASSSYASITKNFTLKVLPGEKLKEEIKLNLSSFQAKAEELEERINESKAKGLDVSVAESMLSQLKEKLSQAFDYINQSDYKSAYELLDDIESLIELTEKALEGKLKKEGIGIVKWIIIAVVVIVGALLAYMLWPVETGYKPGKGYVYKKERGRKIKDGLRKVKDGVKRIIKRGKR